MSRVITFNKDGYDPFIDVIKAYAIICVLVGHTFPYLDQTGYSLWYGMQVPLFVLVQVFHVFKKENQSFNCKKILWRIFIPFIILQTGLFLLLLLFSKNSFDALITQTAIGGGKWTGLLFPLGLLATCHYIAIDKKMVHNWQQNKTSHCLYCFMRGI